MLVCWHVGTFAPFVCSYRSCARTVRGQTKTQRSTLRPGDIITHINGTAIISPKHALRQIHKAERKVTITATRENSTAGRKHGSVRRVARREIKCKRTPMVDSASTTMWNYTVDLDVATADKHLWVRLYVNTGGKTKQASVARLFS